MEIIIEKKTKHQITTTVDETSRKLHVGCVVLKFSEMYLNIAYRVNDLYEMKGHKDFCLFEKLVPNSVSELDISQW